MACTISCLLVGALAVFGASAVRPHEQAANLGKLTFAADAPPAQPEEWAKWAMLQLQNGNPTDGALAFTEDAVKKSATANLLFKNKMDRIKEALNDAGCRFPDEAITPPTRSSATGNDCTVMGEQAEGSDMTLASCEICAKYKLNGGAEKENDCVYVLEEGKCDNRKVVADKVKAAEERASMKQGQARDFLDYYGSYKDETDCPDPGGSKLNALAAEVTKKSEEGDELLENAQKIVEEQLKVSTAHEKTETHVAEIGNIKAAINAMAAIMDNDDGVVAKLDELHSSVQQLVQALPDGDEQKIEKKKRCQGLLIDIDKSKSYVQVYGKRVWVKAGVDVLEHVVDKVGKMVAMQKQEEQAEKAAKDLKKTGGETPPDPMID